MRSYKLNRRRQQTSRRMLVVVAYDGPTTALIGPSTATQTATQHADKLPTSVISTGSVRSSNADGGPAAHGRPIPRGQLQRPAGTGHGTVRRVAGAVLVRLGTQIRRLHASSYVGARSDNNIQSATADFAPGAATWRTGRNIQRQRHTDTLTAVSYTHLTLPTIYSV